MLHDGTPFARWVAVNRPSILFLGSLLSLLIASTASAADGETGGAPELPAPAPPPAASTSGGTPVGAPATASATAPGPIVTQVQAAPASGGLTVVAPLAGGGTMTAVGCSAVSVSDHGTTVVPGAGPCPSAPPPAYGNWPREPRPRYAPDGGRKAAIITAPIVYGLGAFVAGVSYLGNKADCSWSDRGSSCRDGTTSLIAYTGITAVVPSIPRFVVGDVGRGLLYTGLRGASVTTAALVDWGDSHDSWMGPFLLGFAAPVALAVVDMATTPHREDLEDHPDDHNDASEAEGARERERREERSDRSRERARQQNSARVTGVAPVPLADRENKPAGGGLTLMGTF